MAKIFGGDYSRDMWDEINNAKTKSDLREALYFVCCRLQEFENRVDTHVHKVNKTKPSVWLALVLAFVLGFAAGAEFVLFRLGF